MVALSDYSPFGMLLQERKYCIGSYKFSFNGQERENELNSSITSAEYWMYDGRFGRRWNVDPVFKPWRSSYDAFSNNPIIMIDPNGDDDYFDTNGNFLGSDGFGTKIRIVTQPANEIEGFFEGDLINPNIGQLNSLTLSSYLYNNKKSLLGLSIMPESLLAGIGSHYGKQAEVNGDVGTGIWKLNVPAFTKKDEVKMNLLFYGYETLDDYKNIISILTHEKFHQGKDVESYADHARVYMNQLLDNSMNETTEPFQLSQLAAFSVYLLNSKAKDPDGGTEALNLAKQFNEQNTLGAKIDLKFPVTSDSEMQKYGSTSKISLNGKKYTQEYLEFKDPY